MSSQTIGYYITEADVRQYGFQPALTELNFVNSAIPRICELIDEYLGLPHGYFNAVASNVSASARVFYGDGRSQLRVEAYHPGSITEITAPNNAVVPSYRQRNPQEAGRFAGNGNKIACFLEVTDASGYIVKPRFGNVRRGVSGWVDGCPYTVTARWGYVATPETIKQAALETLIAMHRGKDQAFMRVVNLQDNTVTNVDALPPRAKAILNTLRVLAQGFA